MKKLDALESIMLALETPKAANHAGVLQIFRLPSRGGKAYFERVHQALLASEPVQPFNLIPGFSPGKGPHWKVAERYDAHYHVLRIALPAPGSEEQLMEMVSGLYPGLLDRKLPLWRSFLIEGLSDNRFALFTKVHHAYADGISGARMILGSLNDKPMAAKIVPLWALPPEKKKAKTKKKSPPGGRLGRVAREARQNADALTDLAGEFSRIGARLLGQPGGKLATPLGAQKTSLDKQFASGARSFACGSFPMEEMRKLGRAYDATINDVVMTVCDHAMQRYLRENGELLNDRLTGMLAVSTRAPGDEETANAAALALVRLGEVDVDIITRLQQVTHETRQLKEHVRSRSAKSMFYSSMLLFGTQLIKGLPWLSEQLPPNCNLVVSNVPAHGDKPLYLGSARMEGIYTAPIVPAGIPVNVTLAPYAGKLCFGVGAGSEVMSDTQRYATLIEDAYAELVGAVSAVGARPARKTVAGRSSAKRPTH